MSLSTPDGLGRQTSRDTTAGATNRADQILAYNRAGQFPAEQ